MALDTTVTGPNANSYASITQADSHLAYKPGIDTWNSLSANQKEGLLVQATLQIDLVDNNRSKRYYRAMDYRDEQALMYPSYYMLEEFAFNASSFTTNSVTTTNLANRQHYPDDFWNGGALVVYEGAGRGKTYEIADFDASTGTVTINGTFSPAVDNTSQIRVFEAMEDDIINACIEQAYFLALGKDRKIREKIENGIQSRKINGVAETYGAGYGAVTSSGVVMSIEAMSYLNKHIKKVSTLRT